MAQLPALEMPPIYFTAQISNNNSAYVRAMMVNCLAEGIGL